MPLAKKNQQKYTYADYITWPEEERWELIDGTAYNMTPAPGTRHQKVLFNFGTLLKDQLQGKPCRPFIALTDVVLSEKDVVQPDILVVCDERKVTEANIQGAPELIAEVLSPSTATKDKREKKALYEKYGVVEYIVIDPLEQYVERFFLEGDTYGNAEVFGPWEILPLSFLEGVELPLWEVFEMEGSEADSPLL